MIKAMINIDHRFLYLKPSLNMARLFSNMGALTQGP